MVQAATFMTVQVGDEVFDPEIEPPSPCKIVEKNEEQYWLVIKCGGRKQRLTDEEYNDLGYVFYGL